MKCLIERDVVTLVSDGERWSEEEVVKLYNLYCKIFKDKDVVVLHKGELSGRRVGNSKVWGMSEYHFHTRLGDKAEKEFLSSFQNKRDMKMN